MNNGDYRASQWATHCHNIYHAEAGMMTTVSYRE
jgi:FtsP/CotA-like multicopper oxidase with cupredoxin domain